MNLYLMMIIWWQLIIFIRGKTEQENHSTKKNFTLYRSQENGLNITNKELSNKPLIGIKNTLESKTQKNNQSARRENEKFIFDDDFPDIDLGCEKKKHKHKHFPSHDFDSEDDSEHEISFDGGGSNFGRRKKSKGKHKHTNRGENNNNNKNNGFGIHGTKDGTGDNVGNGFNDNYPHDDSFSFENGIGNDRNYDEQDGDDEGLPYEPDEFGDNYPHSGTNGIHTDGARRHGNEFEHNNRNRGNVGGSRRKHGGRSSFGRNNGSQGPHGEGFGTENDISEGGGTGSQGTHSGRSYGNGNNMPGGVRGHGSQGRHNGRGSSNTPESGIGPRRPYGGGSYGTGSNVPGGRQPQNERGGGQNFNTGNNIPGGMRSQGQPGAIGPRGQHEGTDQNHRMGGIYPQDIGSSVNNGNRNHNNRGSDHGNGRSYSGNNDVNYNSRGSDQGNVGSYNGNNYGNPSYTGSGNNFPGGTGTSDTGIPFQETDNYPYNHGNGDQGNGSGYGPQRGTPVSNNRNNILPGNGNQEGTQRGIGSYGGGSRLGPNYQGVGGIQHGNEIGSRAPFDNGNRFLGNGSPTGFQNNNNNNNNRCIGLGCADSNYGGPGIQTSGNVPHSPQDEGIGHGTNVQSNGNNYNSGVRPRPQQSGVGYSNNANPQGFGNVDFQGNVAFQGNANGVQRGGSGSYGPQSYIPSYGGNSGFPNNQIPGGDIVPNTRTNSQGSGTGLRGDSLSPGNTGYGINNSNYPRPTNNGNVGHGGSGVVIQNGSPCIPSAGTCIQGDYGITGPQGIVPHGGTQSNGIGNVYGGIGFHNRNLGSQGNGSGVYNANPYNGNNIPLGNQPATPENSAPPRVAGNTPLERCLQCLQGK